MKVILDLHAVPGSQNGNHHSGTRDGFLEWGHSRIEETVTVIDFFAQRYTGHPSLVAIELMIEPLAPGVILSSLKKYYKAGYDAVRRNLNGQQNADYIYKKSSKQLQEVTRDGGPVSFVGNVLNG